MVGVSLRDHNSFHLSTSCESIIPITSVGDLASFLEKEIPLFKILGGGSNVLLSKHIEGPVLINEIKGFEIIEENEDAVTVKVGGGEFWHPFVMWSVSHGLGGVENLSLIPGKVGAAPIQNIGAYGVEQCDSFVALDAYHLKEKRVVTFKKSECEFGYRDSIFKRHAKDQYFITHVIYRLQKKPTLNISYGAITTKLEEKGITDPSVKDISDIIIGIRQSKLPDPNVIHNSGSFFKNPIISEQEFSALKNRFPDISHYLLPDGMVKIPAAWLIENAGLKGYRNGDAGIYEKHALVLVNHGYATGKELMDVSAHVQSAVLNKYGIQLEPEVNIW